MKIDIKEVAKRSGYSIATVSRVFSKGEMVKNSTKQKILKLADELNYIPNPIARSLSKQSTDTIGVILPDLFGEFFMDIIHGIDEEAYKQNRFVIVSSSHSKRNFLETLVEFMGSGRVDGVILMTSQIDDIVGKIIKKSKRPIVFINAGDDLKNIVNFKINNYEGAFSIVEHLILAHKYKRIGFIKGPEDNYDAFERAKGYYKALTQYKQFINENMILSGNFLVEGGYESFKKLFKHKQKPDAIFAANDMMAIGAYQAAKEMNINIPDDVAIVGFDDINLSQFLIPRLTTVHVPIFDLGSRAVNHLLNIIKNKNSKPFVEILPTKLMIGESCGCKKF